MAGNVGTQSLAVTIRVLMDENINKNKVIRLILKEIRIGFANGLILGLTSFVFIGLYLLLLKGNEILFAFSVSGCVGIALIVAMVIASCVGTTVPLFFKKINIDPAVASGPLITTVNDLVAVLSYYGIAWFLLLQVLKLT
jgi:magnesium transporter